MQVLEGEKRRGEEERRRGEEKRRGGGEETRLMHVYRWVEDGFLEKLITKQKHMSRLTMWGTSRVTDVGVGMVLKRGWDVIGKTSVIISKD